MQFNWDINKNLSNIRKHGIDFFDVIEIFRSPYNVIEDKRLDYGEKRWIAIGKMREVVVIVVYTIRTNVVRIISARKANRKEREVFYEKFK
jgi:uncharacterized protein